MINRLVEPHDVIVVQGGNFHCIYSSLHRACQKKPVACNHCQQTLTGILSTHTHTHALPRSLARALFAHSCRASSGFMRGKDMLYYATVYRFSTTGGWPTSCSLRDRRRELLTRLCSRQQQAAIPCRTAWINSTERHAMWPGETLHAHTRLFTICCLSSLLLSVFMQL